MHFKEMLAPSQFRVTSTRNRSEENKGCSKCNKQCDLCKNLLIRASKFHSSATGHRYPIQQKLSHPSFIWPLLPNAIYNMQATPPLNLKYDFAITSQTCSRTYIHLHTYIPLFSNNYFNKLDMPTGSQLIQVGHVLTKKKKVSIQVYRNQKSGS